MPSSHQMTDEQRRAMFARMHGGGGGGGGSATPYVYDGAGDTTTSTWKGFWNGFWEGAKGGTSIAINNLTHGLTDKLGWTDAEGYVRSGDTAYAVSDLSSSIGSAALESAALGGLGNSLRALAAGSLPERWWMFGTKGIDALTSGLQSLESFRAGDAIDAFRDGRYLNPYLDKGLALVGEAANILGGYQLTGAFGNAVGMLRNLPLSSLQMVGATSKSLLHRTLGQVINDYATVAGGYLQQPFVQAWQAFERVAPSSSKLVKEGYGLYNSVSEVTGGGLRDILSKGGGWTANVARAELAGRAVAEEILTQKTKKAAKAAFEAGDDYTIEGTKPRGTLGTIGFAALGTTGNPIEKMTRKGAWTPAMEEGVYRAKVETVKDAYKSGRIGEAERDKLLKQVAEEKPRRMEGNSLYGVQSAMSKFFQWKGGEAADGFGASTLAKVNEENRAAEKVRQEEAKAAAAARNEQVKKDWGAALGVQFAETPKAEKAPAKESDTSTFDKVSQWLGSGLMYTGHTGVFSPMGGAGTGVAQTWNAVLAGIGAVDYNNRAGKSRDKTYTSPLRDVQKQETKAAWWAALGL